VAAEIALHPKSERGEQILDEVERRTKVEPEIDEAAPQ
jgi:hypothetical protein